jgi:hypothetical protein
VRNHEVLKSLKKRAKCQITFPTYENNLLFKFHIPASPSIWRGSVPHRTYKLCDVI